MASYVFMVSNENKKESLSGMTDSELLNPNLVYPPNFNPSFVLTKTN